MEYDLAASSYCFIQLLLQHLYQVGIAIVGLEAGYVFLYRAGWKVSNGALTANICLAVALLIIGFLLFKETITIKQLAGVVVCGVGLFLINGK